MAKSQIITPQKKLLQILCKIILKKSVKTSYFVYFS